MNQNISSLIEKLESRIGDYFADNDGSHDIGHLKRTLRNALEIQTKEGGDIQVIAVSAFIHDVHRIMQDVEGRFVSPKESLPKIRELIADLPLTDKQKEHICYAIEHHEEYAFGKGGVTVTDIESKIVQDADNLDMLGAIGIERALSYSKALNIPLYNPSVPLYRSEFSEDNMKDVKVSTVHRMNNKHLRLCENMNTKTAKDMAKPKTKLIKDFIDSVVKDFI